MWLFFSLAVEVTGHETFMLVGLSRDVICTTHHNVTKMEWTLVGVSETVEERSDGGKSLTLVVTPTSVGLDGAKFTCKITTTKGKSFEETVTIKVKGELALHEMWVCKSCVDSLAVCMETIRFWDISASPLHYQTVLCGCSCTLLPRIWALQKIL